VTATIDIILQVYLLNVYKITKKKFNVFNVNISNIKQLPNITDYVGTGSGGSRKKYFGGLAPHHL